MLPVRLAIFASGSGSNAENIIRFLSLDKRVEVGLVISNKSEAQVHQRARQLGVPSVTLTRETLTDGVKMIGILEEERIDFLVLAGYLVRIPAELVHAFPNRIVNIHPALLPKYGGKGMYGIHVHQAIVDAKDSESGITIHLVNENYDEGSVIFQARCAVLPNDSANDVAAKVHELEYAYYPKVIFEVLKKEFNW